MDLERRPQHLQRKRVNNVSLAENTAVMEAVPLRIEELR
jgi:hypothetical protein